MPKNKELAQATLNAIREDLSRWNQNDWAMSVDSPEGNVCRTTYCFGGWAAVLSGAKFSVRTYCWRNSSGHAILSIEDFAKKRLGLTNDEANSIFFHFTSDFDEFAERVRDVFELPSEESNV